MQERLNLHVDEAGNQDLSEGLYLVAVVLHEHAIDVEEPIRVYEERLRQAGLDDIPFHGKDLLHGNESYKSISTGDRKRETPTRKDLEARIRRDLAALIFDHLVYFQQFDSISVYYDDGQKALSIALHDALDFVLAKNVADFREADHSARRLLQMADYICTIERVNIAFANGTQTKTQERFFGSHRNFMQSYMKQLVRMRFA